MKKQLVIKYKDGTKVKYTHLKAKAERDTSVIREFMRRYENRLSELESAVVKTYPLKEHKPLVLVENGNPLNQNVYELMHG